MMNEGTVIFSSYTRRFTEWDIARGIKVYRNPDGTVNIQISSETEWDDAEYKLKNITAEEAEQFGKVLLCIPEDEDFGEIMSRAAAWEE
jgi:hypothetical protein